MSLGAGTGLSRCGSARSFVQYFPDDPGQIAHDHGLHKGFPPTDGGRLPAPPCRSFDTPPHSSGFRMSEDIDWTEESIIQPGPVDEAPSKNGLSVQWPRDAGFHLN